LVNKDVCLYSSSNSSVNYCDGLSRCFRFVCTAVFLCCYRFSVNKDLYRCPRGANTGVRWRRRRTQHTDNGGWVQHSGTAACQERQACWTINGRLCSAAMLLLAPWRWLQKQNSELSVPTGLCVRWRCPCSGSFLSKFAVKWILKIPFTLHMLLHYLVKH